MQIDTRLFFTLVWGAGTFVVWALVLRKTFRQWQSFRDRRARHEVLGDAALFLVAFASAAAIAFALFATPDAPDDPLRGFSRLASAIALGAFLAAGVVKLTEAPPERGGS